MHACIPLMRGSSMGGAPYIKLRLEGGGGREEGKGRNAAFRFCSRP